MDDKGALLSPIFIDSVSSCQLFETPWYPFGKKKAWMRETAGSLEGCRTASFSDIGSDVDLLSRSYARELRNPIDREWKGRLEIEFADGATTWTSGVVRNVSWEVYRDFHVDDFCVAVVLDNDHIFGMSVFLTLAKYVFNFNMEEEILQLCKAPSDGSIRMGLGTFLEDDFNN
ncbi:uncharacterized protein N7482_004294 [Penicillium canariense]|uniref:Uncharacterized protein n=1 Tax=Penicillium canariense TaxID=189055 RepID=A0A9W9LQ52_9EURO|nr:uncharacterized protein N7482_004294 [Penicillium canariense]KAJ5168700.1 hypothetical protein N7482_004294 [Penicillium canariense]